MHSIEVDLHVLEEAVGDDPPEGSWTRGPRDSVVQLRPAGTAKSRLAETLSDIDVDALVAQADLWRAHADAGRAAAEAALAQSDAAHATGEAARAHVDAARAYTDAAEAVSRASGSQIEAAQMTGAAASLQVEAAQAQTEASQVQTEAARAHGKAMAAALEASRASVAAAAAQQGAAEAQREAASVQRDAGVEVTAAARMAQDLSSLHVDLARRQLRAQKALAIASSCCALAAVAAAGLLVAVLARLPDAAELEAVASRVAETSAATVAAAVAERLPEPADRARLESVTAELSAVSARLEALEAGDAAAPDGPAPAEPTTTRVRLLAPRLGADGPASAAAVRAWLGRADSSGRVQMAGRVARPAPGARVSVEAFDGAWRPVGGPFAVARGRWSGTVALGEGARPERLLVRVEEGGATAVQIFELR